MGDDEEFELGLIDQPQPWWDTLMGRYIEEAGIDELRRFISLWVGVESQAIPEKMAETAAKNERFLKGNTLKAVDDK